MIASASGGLALLLAVSLAAGASPRGQAPDRDAEPVFIEGLGAVAFPNSGSEAAQDPFLRGVLLLHSFEYEDAAAAFEEAQRIDPDFALAYWGEAMTHNHPVWNERDREAALEALGGYAPTPEKRAAKAPTPRERVWLEAVDALYAPGEKAARDSAYARDMERLVETYPDDSEARAFYALSLLGLSQGSRHLPTYMRAAAIALALFDDNPAHPGAAHYAIHAVDDPIHAPLGLRAARAYAGIAPEAAHAQHMTSHIFLALGLWEEVVTANERAGRVIDRARRKRGLPTARCGHINEWLLYGYLQLGRFDDATELLRGCRKDIEALAADDAEVDWSSKLRGEPGAASLSARDKAARSFARMRALYLADQRAAERTAEQNGQTTDTGFIETAVETTEPSDSYLGLMDLGTAWAAHYRGEPSVLRRSLEELSARGVGDAPVLARYLPVWEGTLESLLLAETGDLEAAVAEARRAAEHEAALPVDYGPPLAAKPPRELEGQLLLESGRADEALAAFGQALQRTPRRALTLLGYARAAAAAGREALAADNYRTLAEILDTGDAGQEELHEAREFLRAWNER